MNIVRRDRGRPHDAPRIVVRLHDGRQRAPNSYPVAPHPDRPLLPFEVEIPRAERLAVARTELEDVPQLDPSQRFQPSTAPFARIAGARAPDVHHLVGPKVSPEV